MRGGPWTAPLGAPADLQTPPLSPRSGLWLREGHAGRGLLPVPLCALLRHAGVGSREQVQPPWPFPCRRSSCGWGRPPGPGGAEGRACGSPAGVGAGGGGGAPPPALGPVWEGGGSGGGPLVPLRCLLSAKGGGDQCKRDKSYLWHEDRIVVPSDRVPALLKWTHESSGHVGADRTLRLFKQWFHTTWTDDQLRKTLQPIVDKCPCRSCKPGDIRDRGLYSTLPIPHCANSVPYVDYTEMPKFGGYDFALMVTCGLTRFTRVFPCTKHITGEETIKILLEEWFCVYGAPKEINSDEDVRVRSDTGWYKRVLRSLNVQVSTGIPYSHTSNPLCERQIRVLKENVRIWCKTERTRDWVRLLPVISLMMNSQESSATGYSPHELFLGRPAWFLHAPYPEDTHSSVGEWVQEQQAKVDKAKAMLQRVRERQWNRKTEHRVPASYQEGDWVLWLRTAAAQQRANRKSQSQSR